MASRHRRVRCENAKPPDTVNIELLNAPSKALRQAAFQKAQRQQRRMAFIHVVALDIGVAELAQDLKPAEAQHNFLRQAVAVVATIQRISQSAVLRSILSQVSIEQVHRYSFAGYPLDSVAPGTHL